MALLIGQLAGRAITLPVFIPKHIMRMFSMKTKWVLLGVTVIAAVNLLYYFTVRIINRSVKLLASAGGRIDYRIGLMHGRNFWMNFFHPVVRCLNDAVFIIAISGIFINGLFCLPKLLSVQRSCRTRAPVHAPAACRVRYFW